jgi:hypothetical protein
MSRNESTIFDLASSSASEAGSSFFLAASRRRPKSALSVLVIWDRRWPQTSPLPDIGWRHMSVDRIKSAPHDIQRSRGPVSAGRRQRRPERVASQRLRRRVCERKLTTLLPP